MTTDIVFRPNPIDEFRFGREFFATPRFQSAATISEVVSAGTGAAAVISRGVISPKSVPSPCFRTTPGTTSTGACFLVVVGNNTPNSSIEARFAVSDFSILEFTTTFSLSNLSDVTDTFVTYAGLLTTRATANTVSDTAIIFRVTGSTLECVTRSSTVETVTNAATIAANTAYALRISITTAGAAFYVNNVLVATHTTNLAISASQSYTCECGAIKSAGTNSRFQYWHQPSLYGRYV